MTLQVINSTTAGATQDLSTRVFMASERLGLPPFSITQNAEEGSVGMSTLVVDDPSGNLTLKGHRRIYFVETSAPAGAQVIGNTYIGTKTIERGDWNVGPLARTFTVNLADTNTLISRRLMVGSDANRPAENDVQRVQWLQTTTECNEFNGSSTYINTTGPVDMDAVDYRGQSVEAILNDCIQASHKNYWIIYVESLGEFSLWYDWDYSQTYDSTIKLSNDEADIDDSVTFAYFPTATLTQDPSRVYSGTLVDFQPAATETTSWVYEQRSSIGDEFVYRDVAYPSMNVKTATAARTRALAYLSESDEEDDVIKLSFVVPAASVNKLMHGMRIEVKGTHWTDYTDFTWMRALNRTVTQMSSTHYRIDAELSPQPNLGAVEQYLTFTQSGGCGYIPWPLPPGGGNKKISFFVQRAGADFGASKVPVGQDGPAISPGLCSTNNPVAGTGYTYIEGHNIDAADGYPIMTAWRDTVVGEPQYDEWTDLATTGNRSHDVEISGLVTGAPTVTATSADQSTSGATFTSPNIVVTGPGYIFGGFSYRAPGPTDGSSDPFVMNAVSPAIDLTRGYVSSVGDPQQLLAPYSWFGYLQVTTAGTYHIDLIRTGTPRNPTRKYGWTMLFWPNA